MEVSSGLFPSPRCELYGHGAFKADVCFRCAFFPGSLVYPELQNDLGWTSWLNMRSADRMQTSDLPEDVHAAWIIVLPVVMRDWSCSDHMRAHSSHSDMLRAPRFNDAALMNDGFVLERID
ncbi:hypothetical protein KOW79_021864 [Hemibagrus wyckioides]|uniref:Uncharacterized protein n=1 Tax=Hemibagrus wyckioides TaxID=337641 RepID=A0A9D3N106_9TELE|nr:hypothetical protein KOW79_021864 [Hemibagrus wyckioides]